MSNISQCDIHGYFDGEHCPECEDNWNHILSGSQRKKVSKFISGALRHFPDDVGLELDESGWVEFKILVEVAQRKYDDVDREAIRAIVQTDPKGRFEIDGNLIRAAYGHSVEVDLESGGTPVPDILYHGTAPENVEPIQQDGLQPMTRQQVHLTDSIKEAEGVGKRHSREPTILHVDAEQMINDGKTITKRGKSVYTVESVPPTYISQL